MKPYTYIVEVAGSCNLRCPSCPQGNLPKTDHYRGFMDVDLFRKIIGKISHDPVHVQTVALYNWGEALLHPHLPELIKIVKNHNYLCNISSNFNYVNNLGEIIAARPDQLRISVSGFSNDTYKRTHRKGNIDLVKSNMITLRRELDRHASKTRIEICYHKYLDNTGKELSEMSDFCQQLGFNFMTLWAGLMPLEKNFAYLNGTLPEKDANLVDMLAIRPDQLKKICLQSSKNDCLLRSTQNVINADGSVALCCGVFDKKYNIAGDFLSISHDDLQKLKSSHLLCGDCMSHGLHRSSVYPFDTIDMAAQENVASFIKSTNCFNLTGSSPSLKNKIGNRINKMDKQKEISMANNEPLVSIGLPSYNGERFLRQTLDSLLAQDYENFEIIISDNASEDRTPEICREYQAQDPRIRFSVNSTNVGYFKNGLKVISLSRGKYFMCATDHDLWHPSFITKCLEVLENDPKMVMCYPRGLRIDALGQPLHLCRNQIDTRSLSPYEGFRRIIWEMSGGDMIFGLMRTAFIQGLGAEKLPMWANDQAIIAAMTLVGTIAHIPEPMFYWRVIRNEDMNYRKKTAPLAQDPQKGQDLAQLELPQLWRTFGEGCLGIIDRSSLSDQEKAALKEDTRRCMTTRYGVNWEEELPIMQPEIRPHEPGLERIQPASQSEAGPLAGPQKKGLNILLTTSAAPCQSPFSTTEKRPPIGIGYLISVLRNAGHQVFFIDNYLKPSDFLETDYLQKNRIDFVGIYANTICYRDTLRMFHRLEYLRQTGQWQGKIIVGGPHTGVAPDTIPPFVDFVVQGEGEQAILDIVEGRVSNRVVKCRRLTNLDDLPMPAWDYFVDLPYNWGGDWFPEGPVFTMNTSRGCPFHCSFCSVGSIWGRRYTCFSAERIVADIEHLVQNYGAKGIYFREDNFTVNKERTVKFCNLLLEKGLKISWACETRVDTLNRELVELMARAGLKACYFGVESGSQKMLDFLRKGIKIDQTRKAFQLCHEFGIKTAASVIVGVPGETQTEINETLALINEIKPTVCWFNVFVGIPNSYLYRYSLEHKLYEFIDDRGLVYLKGHNDRVKAFYGGQWDASIPITKNAQDQIDAPQISIVMSVYNGAPHLEAAIRSILQQTYGNFEFIIINDASTDETSEILRKFDDCRIRVITNPENLGLTKSLNKGIAVARGLYLARMDADDLSLPHRLERQLKFLEQHPDYALVGSPYYQVDDQGRIRGLVKVLTEDRDLRAGLRQQNWFGHGSVMMRLEAVKQLQGYDERFKYAQDYDLWLRLSERYRIANLAEPQYCWRASSSCISHSKAKEQKHFAGMARKRARERENHQEPVRQTDGLPLVSVIVPTFNRPEMLVPTLESILNQTYKNFEIIVINDCGLDVANLVGWLNQNRNITYVSHGCNRGLAAARNTGLKLARGKYIAYLDDDDLFHPNHLETLVTFLEGSDYRVAYTDALRAHQTKEHGRYVTTARDVPYSHDFDPDRLIVANQFPVLCLIHEKSCLDKTGLFDESLTTHEDWDLWIRLSLHYKFAHIKKVTCEFTWRQDGSTMTNQRQADFVRTMEIIHGKYQEHLKDKPHIREQQQQFLQQSKDIINSRRIAEANARVEELMHQADEAVERQEWEKAEGYLRELVQTYPDILEPYLTLSDVLNVQGKHREVWEVLRAARHLDPDAFPLLNRLGLNCRQRGDLTGAMAAYTRLWSLHPQNLDILRQMSAICLDLGLKQEAMGCYREAISRDPGNISLWVELARTAQQLEDQETFAEACRQAAALNAGHPLLRELTEGLAPGNGESPPPTPEIVLEDPPVSLEPVLSSIIMPVFNNLDLTMQCLESIWDNTDEPHEIIVVDNGSSDGTGGFLQQLEAKELIRVIPNPINLGFAKATNQGALAARGDFLVFLNNDTIVQPGWLREMLACARKDEKIGAVGAKLLYPDDTIQHAGAAFSDLKLVYHIYQHYDKDHPAVNKERYFQVVTGACMLIKKDLFFAVGKFDESYQNGFEDVDLCFKIRELGYHIVYNPRAVVYHLESKTPGRFAKNHENAKLFQSKWSDKIIVDDNTYYEEDGIIVEILERRGNQATILAHDSNDNFFWREAVRYRQEGLLDQAEASYLRAVRFNPFDPRKFDIAREMLDLYESRGKYSQIDELRQIVPGLIELKGFQAAVSEVRETAAAG